MDNYVVSYAQNYEDIIINAFFPDIKTGFYVDVGANHPFYHSVTKIFYDKGWTGINIEPNPMLMKQINEHRERDVNLQVGISNNAGVMKLRVYHSRDGLEGISTFSKKMQNQYSLKKTEDTKNYEDIDVDVLTLKDIFEQQKVNLINFIKIDVEGYEKEVIEGNDWNKYRPELICIESNHVFNDWKTILINNKYSLVFNDGLNDYYIREESIERSKMFDYAKVFLSDRPVVIHDIVEKITNYKNEIARQKKDLKFARSLADARQYEIEKLEKELRLLKAKYEEISSLKKHIKKRIKTKLNN